MAKNGKRYLTKPVVIVTAALAVGAGTPLALAVFTVGNPTLTGSSFQSGDGDTTGSGTDTDWGNATSAIHFLDTVDPPNAAASLPDFSFGQGAKEDIPNPNIVTGSIPPNKSDLTDFLTAYETKVVNNENHTFLYLGWKRTNNLGNANMDFEFNQNPTQTYLNPTGTGTPMRTAGDLLVTFDFPGSGTPVLSLFRWVNSTNGTKADCYSASSLPCWGKGSLGDLGSNANAGVSTDTRFGEAGIDLTAAGVFSTSSCTTFGDALLKSRSSSSFTSELKDFVQLPAGSISVSNCGSVTVHKVDDGNNPITGALTPAATFELWLDNPPLKADQTDHTTHEASNDTEESSLTCSLPTTGSSCTISSVPFGNYWVVETQTPTGYMQATDGYFTISSSSSTASVTLTDNRNPAEIDITKVDDNNAPVDGAVFKLYNDNAPVGTFDNSDTVTSLTCTTANHSPSPGDGTCAITNILTPGHYVVHEETTPAGYDSAADQFVNVTLGSTYSVANGNLSTFTDTRNFKVIVLVCNQVTGALYPSSVTFDGSTKTSLAPTSTALSVTQQSAVCGLAGTDGATFPGKHASATAKPGSVTIPLHQ